jgi:hypothetical protein
MGVKFTNNAYTTLASTISASATSFDLASAASFPTLAAGDWTYVSLTDEVVKVTAISGVTCTCDAVSGGHSAGIAVELRMTAELLSDFAEDLGSGYKGGDIASASPTVIDTDGDYFNVTGTTGFSAFTVAANRLFTLQFAGALTMTHHATNLDLPGEADITTAAGDVAQFFSTGANTVQCVNYTRASGAPVVAGAIADDSVTYAKIQNVVDDERILGRVSGADGVIEELTKAQVLTFANVEDGADVTDATNVTAAGALMDSECAGLAAVKATTGTFLTADQTKLDGIEASADVTDATNVTAAGALMDSEVTNLAEVKAFADSDYATAAQGTLATNALPKGGGTMTGDIVGGDTTISAVNLKDYGETTNALGSAGGSRTINLTLGNSVTATVSSSTVTWTFSNPTASDEGCGFTLVLTNGGSQTVNWPGSVDWAGGSAPSLTSSGVDVLAFWTVNAGTTWYGFAGSLDNS